MDFPERGTNALFRKCTDAENPFGTSPTRNGMGVGDSRQTAGKNFALMAELRDALIVVDILSPTPHDAVRRVASGRERLDVDEREER